MQNLLFTIAIIMVIIWALGFFVFNATGLIHILLLMAVIVEIFRLIKAREIKKW